MIFYKNLYTMDEVTRLFHISERDLWELFKRDRLKHVIIFGEIFVRGIDLEKYINNLSAL